MCSPFLNQKLLFNNNNIMTKTKLLFIAILLSLLGIAGCKKNELKIIDLEESQYRTDDVLFSKSALLKRILHTYNLSTGNYNSSVEYEYDKSEKIIRVSYKSFEGEEYSYDQYEYGTNGKLKTISSYQSNGTKFRNQIYSYNTTGYTVRMETSSEYSISTYINDLLMKTEYYGKDLSYTYKYQYDSKNRLINETYYDKDGIALFIKDHEYIENLCVKTFTHTVGSDEFISDERMIYDRNDNLILKIANIPSLSSNSHATAFYVNTRYVYK